MTDLTEKYHIAKPVCKKEGFRLKKEHCLCVKKKTRKLKPKLKIVKSLESVKVPKKSKSSDKKPPSIENEPMHQMIMQTLQKKVKTPTPPPPPPGSPVSPNQHLKKATPAKSKTAKKVRKRCPKGTQKNPKTGRCVKKETLKKMKKQAKKKKSVKKESAKKSSVKKSSVKKESVRVFSSLENVLDNAVKVQEKQLSLKPKRKRCPKGTRKNAKTGECEPNNKHSLLKKHEPNKKKTPLIVPSNTPAIQEDLGNEIASILSNPDTKYKTQKIQQSIVSFSPEINKKLVTKRKSVPGSAINEITSCINFDKYVGRGPKVFVKGVGCKPYFSAEGQHVLMKALSYSRKNLNMSQVIAPKQVQSNCWFNTMFMVYFVSDKGRKFFKFFRQLMITGKKANGSIIKPPRLLNAFASLNLAIEASLSGAPSFDTFNTNLLIKQIYSGIPPKFRTKSIKSIGAANNPLNYYQAIMRYLNTENVKLLARNISKGDIPFHVFVRNELISYLSDNGIGPPEVLAIEILDEVSKNSSYHKPEELVYTNIDGQNVTYKLDSAVVRDTKKRHFCAVLEIGGKQCGFDGASFRKLSEFNWKSLLNSDKDWTFEGSTWSGTSNDILWNFKNGYQILFYYRV